MLDEKHSIDVNALVALRPLDEPPGPTGGPDSERRRVFPRALRELARHAKLLGCFQVGDAISQAGGHNADYAGLELKYGW